MAQGNGRRENPSTLCLKPCTFLSFVPLERLLSTLIFEKDISEMTASNP